MKVSVAMTIYNGEQYLLEQLNSILNQSLSVDEVIICDDGSKDQSISIIEAFINKNALQNSWKLFINEKNLGYADNFYSAMKKTTGDYVFFSDQDDIWLEHKVESMVSLMEKHSEIQLLCSEYEPYYCTEDAPIISENVLKGFLGDSSLEKLSLNHKTIFIGSEGCTMCVRKNFLEEIDAFWFSGWAQDEYVWKLSLCKDGCYIYHKPTLKRRLHSNNVSKRKMHELTKRIHFLRNLKKSHEATYAYAKFLAINPKTLNLIQKNIHSVQLRIDLLENKKIWNIIPLFLFHSNHYHSRKSIPVEFIMAVKG